MIKLIIAIGPNNLIGNGNKMAWHISEEFAHFKKTTMSHSLLFGQSTFLGLPSKLPNRTTYVLGYSKTPEADHSLTSVDEVNELFNKFRDSKEILFIAGGKSIYEQFYNEAEELIVSYILDTNATGDVYLNWDLSKYSKEKIFTDPSNKFIVYKYKKEK